MNAVGPDGCRRAPGWTALPTRTNGPRRMTAARPSLGQWTPIDDPAGSGSMR